MARNLVYTVALDQRGERGHRNLAKMLVSSLLRTRLSGDIVVFHNAPSPLFMIAREGVREVRLEIPASARDGDFQRFAVTAKQAAATHLDPAGYDKVMFLDCDAIALRNIDHLLAGPWELAIFPEPRTRIQAPPYGAFLTAEQRAHSTARGANSGSWAVAAPRFTELMRRWEEIDRRHAHVVTGWRDQQVFNRLALEWEGEVMAWASEEIALPLCNDDRATYRGYSEAAILHAASGDGLDYKLRFLFSAFAGTFLFDPQLALLNIMEM